MAKKISELPAASAAAAANELEINEAGASKKVTLAQVGAHLAAVKPAFKAHRNGVNQTSIADATWTKAALNVEAFDIGSYYDAATNYRWTPPSGRVRMSARAQLTGTFVAGNLVACSIYKNGTLFAAGSPLYAILTTGAHSDCTVTDTANGTDYYEMYVYGDTSSGTVTLDGGTIWTWFEGEQL